MKTDIHPNYTDTTVTCSCGNSFQTRSTVEELHVELCNECHPFFTGKQKLVDSGGRVERFRKRYGGSTPKSKKSAKAAAPAAEASAEDTTEDTAEAASEEPAES